MHYELCDFYRRDTSFDFNEEANEIDWLSLKSGQRIEVGKPLVFNVDRIDSYINDYDLLPTSNTPLVSERFKILFSDLKDDLQFVKATIVGGNNRMNEDYYFMNVLNVIPIMDKNRSVYEIKKYGKAEVMTIKELYITDLTGHSIVRMAEHKSYLIVTDDFRKRCINANLKGINFVPEGHSAYK